MLLIGKADLMAQALNALDVDNLSLDSCWGGDVRGGCYVIPRILIEQSGSRTIENCVILCAKCCLEAKQNKPREIPYDELPYFRA